MNPPTALLTLGAAAILAYLRGRRAEYLVYAGLLGLIHQTAVLFILATTLHSVAVALLDRRPIRAVLSRVLFIAAPVLPLVAWVAYQAFQLGWVFNQGLLHNRHVFFDALKTNVVRHFLYDTTPDAVNRWNFLPSAAIVVALARFRKIPSLHDERRAGLLFFLVCAVHVTAFSYSDFAGPG